VIEKGDAAIFRCSLSGRATDRWLEVPAWMFDRVVSANWRIAAVASVDLVVLGALAELLRDGVNDACPPTFQNVSTGEDVARQIQLGGTL
jgi:hypothetical protein